MRPREEVRPGELEGRRSHGTGDSLVDHIQLLAATMTSLVSIKLIHNIVQQFPLNGSMLNGSFLLMVQN